MPLVSFSNEQQESPGQSLVLALVYVLHGCTWDTINSLVLSPLVPF